MASSMSQNLAGRSSSPFDRGLGPGLMCRSGPPWPEWEARPNLLPEDEAGAAVELATRWAERGLSAKLQLVS